MSPPPCEAQRLSKSPLARSSTYEVPAIVIEYLVAPPSRINISKPRLVKRLIRTPSESKCLLCWSIVLGGEGRGGEGRGRGGDGTGQGVHGTLRGEGRGEGTGRGGAGRDSGGEWWPVEGLGGWGSRATPGPPASNNNNKQLVTCHMFLSCLSGLFMLSCSSI